MTFWQKYGVLVIQGGGGICAQLCIYVFRGVQIVVYDMGGCHMDVVIDCEEVD